MNNLEKIELALSPLGDFKKRGNQLKYNCPWCESSGAPIDKFNLEVNIDKNIFNCWACSKKGVVKQLVQQKGVKNLAQEFNSIQTYQEKSFLVQLPDSVPVSLNKTALSYLLKRGITINNCKKYNIRYCISGGFKKQIIFPSYNKTGVLNYFVAHDFINKKYTKCDSNSNICFYESFIDFNYPILLVEGIYDALPLPNCIPLLGLTVNKYLLETLNNQTIILILDEQIDLKRKNYLIKQLKEISYLTCFQVPEGLRDPNYAINNSIEFKGKLKQIINETTENSSHRRFTLHPI